MREGEVGHGLTLGEVDARQRLALALLLGLLLLVALLADGFEQGPFFVLEELLAGGRLRIGTARAGVGELDEAVALAR